MVSRGNHARYNQISHNQFQTLTQDSRLLHSNLFLALARPQGRPNTRLLRNSSHQHTHIPNEGRDTSQKGAASGLQSDNVSQAVESSRNGLQYVGKLIADPKWQEIHKHTCPNNAPEYCSCVYLEVAGPRNAELPDSWQTGSSVGLAMSCVKTPRGYL